MATGLRWIGTSSQVCFGLPARTKEPSGKVARILTLKGAPLFTEFGNTPAHFGLPIWQAWLRYLLFSTPQFGAIFLSDMLSRIPDRSRSATLTEAPNNERIRCATGGANLKSPAGVLASLIEKRSKNFAKADVGIILACLVSRTLVFGV